jgi:mannan endo-1,4-beta-mannosidase
MPNRILLILGLAACLLLSATATATAAPAAETQAAKKKPPRYKQPPAYWGAWLDDRLTGKTPPWDMSGVSAFERIVGKGLSLVEFSVPFYDCLSSPCIPLNFPTKEMSAIRSYGAIPVLSWGSSSIPVPEPPNPPIQPDLELRDLISGAHDSYIREYAEAARNWGSGFFLRFDWEMNGDWFPWGSTANGALPGEFVAAWRHVHDIFTRVGATNATWVWCPYAEVKRKFAPLATLYPGDSYVDWTCMDGFNWAKNPTNPHPWRTFDKLFSSTYRQITKRIAPRKPMILAEFASTGAPKAKAKWIRDMFKVLASKYRRVRGLVWFNKVDRRINWPLDISPAAARAFAKGIRRKAFHVNTFSAGIAGPVPPPR